MSGGKLLVRLEASFHSRSMTWWRLNNLDGSVLRLRLLCWLCLWLCSPWLFALSLSLCDNISEFRCGVLRAHSRHGRLCLCVRTPQLLHRRLRGFVALVPTCWYAVLVLLLLMLLLLLLLLLMMLVLMLLMPLLLMLLVVAVVVLLLLLLLLMPLLLHRVECDERGRRRPRREHSVTTTTSSSSSSTTSSTSSTTSTTSTTTTSSTVRRRG